MKKTIMVMCLLFAASAFASQPTTTRTLQRGIGGARYNIVKHTFTATTGLDTIIVLNENGNAFDSEDLEVNRTIYSVQFQTAETTAANSDFNVLWQVSAVVDASATVFPGQSGQYDWTTVETDANANSLSFVATFDAANYKGMKVRALLAESDALADAAVAIEAYVTYPRK